MAWRRRPRTALDAPAVDDNMSDQPRSDIAEFRDVVKTHEGYLYANAVRLCGSPDAAKDLVQETFARALLHFGKFEQGTNVRAWLMTILTRRFLDQLKHDKVVTRSRDQLAIMEVVECDLDMTIPSDPDVALWDAVQQLDADLREVIELRYVQDLSYKQIADSLQLPVGTVGRRLMRAHERLRELLKQRTS